MGAARAHLWAIGWQPTHFESFAHAHLGQQLAEQQNTLPAEASDVNGKFLRMPRDRSPWARIT